MVNVVVQAKLLWEADLDPDAADVLIYLYLAYTTTPGGSRISEILTTLSLDLLLQS